MPPITSLPIARCTYVLSIYWHVRYADRAVSPSPRWSVSLCTECNNNNNNVILMFFYKSVLSVMIYLVYGRGENRELFIDVIALICACLIAYNKCAQMHFVEWAQSKIPNWYAQTVSSLYFCVLCAAPCTDTRSHSALCAHFIHFANGYGRNALKWHTN